jgi:hypothetical protein
MNLEDRIRSSARGQVDRYHPADDLIPRIEHRRRQRVARRATATGVAALVLFGGGVLALTSLRDRDRESPVAQSTVLSVNTTVDGSADTDPQPPTTTLPAATSAPTTVTPATTTPQQVGGPPSPTDPPPTDPPVANDANVPMPTANADGSVWAYGEFWNVPQLGTENVRGSGCGSSGQIGDQIPDGLWAGFITGVVGDVVNVDPVCIYSGSAAQQVMSSPSAVILNDDPNYLVVNNSTRARAVPMDASIVLRLGVRNGAGQCVDGTSSTQWGDIPADRQVWVRIHDGRVTWVFADCAA